MKLRYKIFLAFLSVSLASMTLVTLLSYFKAKTTLKANAFNHLTSIRNAKAEEVSNYFLTLRELAQNMSESKSTILAFLAFDSAFKALTKTLTNSQVDLQKLKESRDQYFYSKFKSASKQSLSFNDFRLQLPQNKEAVFLQGSRLNRDPQNVEAYESYFNAINQYGANLVSFVNHTGFVDLLLIESKTGNVIYSVADESDLGASLLEAPLKATKLKLLFDQLRNVTDTCVRIADYEVYFPADNSPQAFIACPILKGGRNLGLLALQLPLKRIDEVMTFHGNWKKEGMGKSGEVYLVGNHYMLRSQSRFFIEDSSGFLNILTGLNYRREDLNYIRTYHSTLINVKIKTKATESAIQGKEGTELIVDYRGKKVLSSFMPLNMYGMNWCIVAEMDVQEAFQSIASLEKYILLSFCLASALLFILSFTFSTRITSPLKALSLNALELSKGNFQTVVTVDRKDEVGVFAKTFKSMQATINKMIEELVHSKREIELRQREILDSIQYAKDLQYNILASPKVLENNLIEHFVLFKPKDIVSGDFYWAINVPVAQSAMNSDGFQTFNGQLFYLAVCDSTGHGVPGAFMSILNASLLNEAIVEQKIYSPNEILNKVRMRLIETFSNEQNQDGMDGILLLMDPSTNVLQFAGAYNPPILIRANATIECKVDRLPIGRSMKEDSFRNFTIRIEPGDRLYLLTDGFQDQFGGQANKKYTIKKLTALLLKIHQLALAEQKSIINTEFESWKGSNDQIDDVLIVCIRF